MSLDFMDELMRLASVRRCEKCRYKKPSEIEQKLYCPLNFKIVGKNEVCEKFRGAHE